MHRSRRRLHETWVFLVPALAATALAGCGASDTLPRQPITGVVKLSGQPLKTGLIEFQPAEPGMATTAASAIANGAYSLAQSEGLQPGKYEVRISSAPQTIERPAGALPGDNPMPPAKELIPPKYNANTTLSVTVAKDKPNKFDFDLQEK
jgi:hypothetical protein